MTPLEGSINEFGDFLTAYANSYETYDPASVAAFIHCPCIFGLGGETVLLDTNDQILDFLRTGLKTYKENDCVRFEARLLSAKRIGPHFALIDVEWSPENAAGVQTMHFSTTYNLVNVAGEWRVATIMRHDPEIMTSTEAG